MFIFSEEKRPKLQQERPDLSDSELTRLLARMWNELPDKKKVTCPYSVVLYCRRSVRTVSGSQEPNHADMCSFLIYFSRELAVI